ncbi:MAG: DUF1194 domain-containing protein [Bosea sp. (in: a-proteobacteria)]
MRRWLAFVSMCLLLVSTALWVAPAGVSQAQTLKPEVDVALVLAVDISFSMDLDELALQREGYVQALKSQVVKDAIAKGAVGKIALTYVEWAGLQAQYVTVPWMIIDSADAADAFAEKLAEAPTRRGRRTSVSGAIDLSMRQLNDVPASPLKRVIDISGDGPNNEGRSVTEARDDAVAKGVTINGLPVMLKAPGYLDIGELDIYYEDCVIGGIGAFSIPIRERVQFVEAVRTKILLEIALAPPALPQLIHRAQAQQGQPRKPRVSCAIGERQWRDRFGN